MHSLISKNGLVSTIELKIVNVTNVQILFNISQTIIVFPCYDVTIKKQGVIRHDDL